ncbi:hypothetical protein HK405_010059 [Cladochytrium tenue]|nr:hypothetical protein HK405_010059 [Cladochytrium tenue]
MVMELAAGSTNDSSIWIQTVTNIGTACQPGGGGQDSADGCTVSFTIDMKGQYQQWAELIVELYGNAIVDFDTVFENITLRTDHAEPTDTSLCNIEGLDCVSASFDASRTTCTIGSCTLPKSVAPTTTTSPPPRTATATTTASSSSATGGGSSSSSSSSSASSSATSSSPASSASSSSHSSSTGSTSNIYYSAAAGPSPLAAALLATVAAAVIALASIAF